jgi:hypothetical protein
MNKGMIVRSMDPLMEDLNTAVNRNPDVELVHKAMPVFLQQMDGLILSSPEPRLLLRASEAYYAYTFAFVEDTDRQRASILYLKARDYAIGELKRYRIFDMGLERPAPEFMKALRESLDARDIAMLFWAANNWRAWIGLNLDNTVALKDIPRVEAMLLYVIEVDETFCNGAAHASLGALYAMRTRALGGDPVKAREHFDKAFAISGNSSYIVHLMYARYYACQIQDRSLFVRVLEKIVESPENQFPDKAFANEVARMKAGMLLKDVDAYFKGTRQ